MEAEPDISVPLFCERVEGNSLILKKPPDFIIIVGNDLDGKKVE